MASKRPVLDEARERPAQRPLRSTSLFDSNQQAAIRAQVQRLAESPAFRSSKRCRLFLEHVVEQSLAESPGPLKERVLGIKVFGRQPSYDTSADPVVRVTAGEIRRRLGQYYADPAHQRQLRIDLPAGSYTPTFNWPSPNGQQANTAEEPPAATNGAGAPMGFAPSSRRFLGIALGCLAGAALISTMLASGSTGRSTAFEQFWAPLVHSKVPVLVCTGSNEVYELSPRFRKAIDSASESGDTAKPLTVLPGEVQRIGTRFVSVADAVAIAHLAALLHEHGTPYHVRENRATSFSDLRASPTILVGMFSNAWTLELGSEFRFVPFPTPDGERILIRDRQHPERADWQLERPWPALDVSRDYALVSRVLDPTTGNMVVIGAGITPFGTTAALELLTSPDALEAALSDAPRDWDQGNLQIVLTTRVMDRAAGPPDVLATHFW